jgi:hypothetical protein
MCLVGCGAVAGITAGYLLVPGRFNAPILRGIPFGLALGIPQLIFAAAYLSCGILLLVTKKKLFACLGATTCTLQAVSLCALMFFLVGGMLQAFITLTVVAAPIVEIWSLVRKYKANPGEESMDNHDALGLDAPACNRSTNR